MEPEAPEKLTETENLREKKNTTNTDELDIIVILWGGGSCIDVNYIMYFITENICYVHF